MANERVGVVLAGCGHFDGAEIREAIFALLALDEQHAHAVCMAPDIDQMHVVDHITGQSVVSTPAYMYSAPRISEVRRGVSEMVGRVLGLVKKG